MTDNPLKPIADEICEAVREALDDLTAGAVAERLVKSEYAEWISESEVRIRPTVEDGRCVFAAVVDDLSVDTSLSAAQIFDFLADCEGTDTRYAWADFLEGVVKRLRS